MTEKTNTPGLLTVDLETCIILPFQIASGSNKGSFDAEVFRQSLAASKSWERAAQMHEPDRIATQGVADEAALKRMRYQAYNYFHPFVRSFWYDSNLVQRFRHRHLTTLKTSFHDTGPIVFDAVADLYHFLPDIAVLVLHLKAQDKLPLSVAQDCLDALRRIYPPYIGSFKSNNEATKESSHTDYPGHFPDTVELLTADGQPLGQFRREQIADLITQAHDCEKKQSGHNEQKRPAYQLGTHSHILASHWSALLQPLGADSEYRILQLGDDRAALASKINLYPPADIPLINCVDRGNLIRLCFADAKGSDRLPYAQRYLAQFETRFCYDRFWYQDGESADPPSRIMNCGYAFSWLGAGSDEAFFTNDAEGAPAAFRHIYVPMAIIAHFQKAALLVASRRLADLSPYAPDGKPSDLDTQAFEALEANFIAFTQTYWFNEITPQEQGVELFDMWRRELHLPQLYQEHRQELQDIVAFINGKEAARQTTAAINLNSFALVFALIGVGLTFLGVLTGIMGMNPLPERATDAANINNALLVMTTDTFDLLSKIMPLSKTTSILVGLLITVVGLVCAWRKLGAGYKKLRKAIHEFWRQA